MKVMKTFLSAVVLFTAPLAFAVAPVTDLTQAQAGANNGSAQPIADQQVTTDETPVTTTPRTDISITPPAATQELTLQQRILRLEQQVNNLVRMNLPQEISNMQEQIQQLSGQLQVQEHQIKVLDQQQRSFYQDLDTQIKQIKSLNENDNSTPNNVVPVNPSVAPTSDKTASKPKASTPTKKSNKIKETQSYNNAFELLRKKKYSQSKAAFKSYIVHYPKGQFVANTHYWMGEIALVQKHYLDAQKQFKIVITKYTNSPKTSDAKLKLATVEAARGQYTIARRQLKDIMKAYPGSTASQLASIQLQQMELMQQTNS